MYELMSPDQPNQLYVERVQIGERERIARRIIRERLSGPRAVWSRLLLHRGAPNMHRPTLTNPRSSPT